MDDNNMLNFPTPLLGVVATDLVTGKQVIFSNSRLNDRDKICDDNYEWVCYFDKLPNSKLSSIVRSSCSFPGMYIPKRYGNYVFVDGGLTNNLPSDIARGLGADRVISIDLGETIDYFQPNGALSILLRSFRLIYDRDKDNNDKYHDIYLNPNLTDIYTFETSAVQECFERGYKYGKDQVKFITYALESNSPITL
jgi:NTE family protein